MPPITVYEYEFQSGAERRAFVEQEWLGEVLRAAFRTAKTIESKAKRLSLATN